MDYRGHGGPSSSKEPNSDGVIPEIPGYQISKELQTRLREQVGTLLHTSPERFPGAQPVSLLKQHLDLLETQDYYVCEKSDGLRCLVYAVCDSNGRPATYCIDRKNRYWFIPHLQFPTADTVHQPYAKFHHQTLFDGELVVDKKANGTYGLQMYCFDLLVCAGQSIVQRPLNKRLGYLYEWVAGPHRRLCKINAQFAKAQPFGVVMKMMDKSYGAQKILEHDIPRLLHKNDGLIYVAVNAPYQLGTTEAMLKWKPADENSVDFKLRLQDSGNGVGSKPVFVLYVWEGGNQYRPYAEMSVTNQEWEQFQSRRQPLDGRVVEVRYDPSVDPRAPWRFMRFRDDKPNGNHVSVVDKILCSISDGVDAQDIIAHCSEVRAAWKAREAAAEQ
ncbi:Dcp1p-Dcp2p decapping enzyme complex alpha subunit [Dispira simplex]|nr:Dcp1p-Dcp2p decapping enzyme complex alpha subunit [Dispira simplex]